jgi:prepilin-type N-terminal cleavage/methylation domain-containing protein
MMRAANTSRGFTLIELLVVIAIIAVWKSGDVSRGLL